MNKIIVIGTGNIGKRHIQAISNLKIKYKLICYDHLEESLISLKKFIRENNIKLKNLKIENKFEKTINNIDNKTIIILATTANQRKEILEKIIQKKPLSIIIEKPVCQKEEDYNSIIRLKNKLNIPIYVNFPRHSSPTYKKIFSEIRKKENIIFIANDTKVGFACNGIHLLELATWLLNSKKYKILNSEIESIYETKREGFFDFSGRLTLKLGKNLSLININNQKTIPSIEIITENKIYKIDEEKQKIIIIDNKNLKINKFELPHTSQITDKIIQNILNNKIPNIPTIEETYLPHKILFNFMKKNNIQNINFT